MHHEEHIEFGSVVQEEMLFKRFLIWSSGSPPVWRSRTIYAILKVGIMGNIHVKLYERGSYMYGKLTWESVHAWNLILCSLIVWGMTFICIVHLCVYPLLIFDAMYHITK